MDKNVIIKYVKKLSEEFDTSKSPSYTLEHFKDNLEIAQFVSSKFKDENFVIFLMLLPYSNLSENELGEKYDKIINNLTYLKFVHIDAPYAEYECPECYGNRRETCEECDGDGETSDGETCEMCGGDGEVRCDRCDGRGEIVDHNQNSIQLVECLTHNLDFINHYKNLDYGDTTDYDYYESIFTDRDSLVIDVDYEFSREFYEYGEGEVVFTNFIQNPKITKLGGLKNRIKVN